MIEQQLLDYVHEQLGFGASPEAIREAAAQAGWSEEEVQAAFDATKEVPATPTPTIAGTAVAPVSTPAVAVTPTATPSVATPSLSTQTPPHPVTTFVGATPALTTMSMATKEASTKPATVIPVSSDTAHTTRSASKMFMLGVIVLLVVLVGGIGYYSYTLQQQISQLSATAAKATSDLAVATQQNTQLQQQVAQLSCKGTWSNNACVPFAISLSVTPSMGSSSPLKVTFTARVPNIDYGIDFGDGSASLTTLSGTTCTPDTSGLCTITLAHTYATSSTSAKFTAALTQNGAAVASTEIGIAK